MPILPSHPPLLQSDLQSRSATHLGLGPSNFHIQGGEREECPTIYDDTASWVFTVGYGRVSDRDRIWGDHVKIASVALARTAFSKIKFKDYIETSPYKSTQTTHYIFPFHSKV